MGARRPGRVLVGSVLAAVVVVGAGCSSPPDAAVGPGDRAAWERYRTQVLIPLERVLGPSAGLVDECKVDLDGIPPDRFGIDLGPTLEACAGGDLSTARLEAHRQIATVGLNDQALGIHQ